MDWWMVVLACTSPGILYGMLWGVEYLWDTKAAADIIRWEEAKRRVSIEPK